MPNWARDTLTLCTVIAAATWTVASVQGTTGVLGEQIVGLKVAVGQLAEVVGGQEQLYRELLERVHGLETRVSVLETE